MIRMSEVGKTYPGGVTALTAVSMHVDAGELVGIVGPSGSGKSTLMNIIGTLDRPTSGLVRVAGHDVATLSDRDLSALRGRAIGFVFQQFFLLPGMSALDNVADGLLYHGVARAERRERAAEVLERVGLGHRLRHNPEKLSGGERQRVAIARALIGRPAVVLADEPTGNLDPQTAGRVFSILLQLVRASGLAALIATHNMDLAARMDRRVTIRDGMIEQLA